MRLTVLGSSAAYPVPGNPSSGYLVEAAGTRAWLDAGTGTFSALQTLALTQGWDWRELDAVILSHAHADHCLDLVPYYYALRFRKDPPPPGENRRLPAFWPAGTRELLGRIVEEEEGEDKLGRVFAPRTVADGDEVGIGPLKISFAVTDHGPPTLAARFDDGHHRLVYTADTGPAVDLAPFAKGADLLLADATYQEDLVGPPVHLTAAQAGELARRAGVHRLVLTHVWPTFDPERSLEEARAVAGGVPVALARPGAVFDIG